MYFSKDADSVPHLRITLDPPGLEPAEYLPQLEKIQEVLPSRRDEAHFRCGVWRLITPNLYAGVQHPWIQGDSKVGTESASWQNTYLITDIERLEMDSVVGRLVENRRLNNLDYVE